MTEASVSDHYEYYPMSYLLPAAADHRVPSSTFKWQHSYTPLGQDRDSDTSGVTLSQIMSPMIEDATKSLEKLDDKAVTELCEDYAAYTRVNISEEHGQVVTQIAAIEEQISTFSEMLTDIQANKYGITYTQK